MSSAVLPVFSKLWHSDPRVRIEHSAQLVAHLEAAQRAHALVANSNGVHDDSLASDVEYTLKRLVRGLGSPRESSRLGFAVALTEILARLEGISPRQVLPILMNSSQLSTGVKGAEERDLLFARLFGIHAVIASGLMFRPSSSLHDWRLAIEEALYLGQRKPWLKESAGWVVQGAARELAKRHDLDWRQEGLQAVFNAAFSVSDTKQSLDWTPERLALAILLQRSDLSADWNSVTKSVFKDTDILSSTQNLPVIARVLKGLSADSNAKKANEQAQSLFFGNGKLHYVWSEILEAYFPKGSNESEDQPKKKKAKLTNGDSPSLPALVPFEEFYSTVVDANLFKADTASTSAKYVGLVAFKACLVSVPAELAPKLFTPNLRRILINHLAKGNRTLNAVAKEVTSAIPEAARARPEMAYDILMKLLEAPHGTTKFDTLTHTKTIESVAAALDAEGVRKYTTWLFNFIVDSDQTLAQEDDEDASDAEMDTAEAENSTKRTKTIESRRSWAIDQLLLLVRRHAQQIPLAENESSSSAANASKWLTQIIQYLVLHGFFSLQSSTKKSDIEALRYKPESPFSSSIHQIFRSRLLSALTHLITINPRCRGQSYTQLVLDTLQTLQQDSKHVAPLWSEDQVKERKETLATLRKLQLAKDRQRAQNATLLVEVLLLFAYDPESQDSDLLEQVRDAVNALFPSELSTASRVASTSAAAEDIDEDGEEAEPISVLIDLLVTVLQRSSALLRITAERVFAAFSSEVSEQALQLLLDQISPESAEQLEDLADEDGDDASSDAGDGAKHAAAPGSNSDDESDSEDEDDDEDDGDLQLEVDEELQAQILAALKGSNMDDISDDEEGSVPKKRTKASNGKKEDDEDGEDGEDESDEELLNDDEMMELDEKLAEVFRSRKSAQKGAREARQAAHDAQLKLIDIIEIYAKQQASNPLLLQTVLPLFNVARRSANESTDLSSKARRVLQNIVYKPKEYPVVQDTSDVINLLKAVHSAARRSGSSEAQALAASTSIYLSRVILSETGTASQSKVIEVYTSSLNDWLIRKTSHLAPNFFETFVKRFRMASWALREPLLAACSESSTTNDKHKRAAAFNILSEVMVSRASFKNPEAKSNVLEFAPGFVAVVLETLQMTAKGEGMQLQVFRLREIIKACSQAVRATKVAAKDKATVWKIWRIQELCNAFASIVKASSAKGNNNTVKKTRSFTVDTKKLIDQILEGSGRAKMQDIENGLPPLGKAQANGKSSAKSSKQDLKQNQAAAIAVASSEPAAESSSKKRKASDSGNSQTASTRLNGNADLQLAQQALVDDADESSDTSDDSVDENEAGEESD